MYHAVTEVRPPAETGTLSHWLKKDPEGRKAIITEKEQRGSQFCKLEYKVLETKGKNTLLEIRPQSGRFHQIRAQLAFIGCPIAGDVLYGGKPWREHEIKLHAVRLTCRHPKTGEPLELECVVEGW